MPPAITTRQVAWCSGWAGAIVAAWIVQHGPPAAELVQFLIQFAAAAAIVTMPGLLAINLWPRRPPRLPVHWQIVLLLVVAAWLAWAPWISPEVSCLEC
jgi:hypothetical protein